MRKREIKPNAIYSTEELAMLFNTSQRTIQRYIKQGKIRKTKLNKILGSDVLEYLKNE